MSQNGSQHWWICGRCGQAWGHEAHTWGNDEGGNGKMCIVCGMKKGA